MRPLMFERSGRPYFFFAAFFFAPLAAFFAIGIPPFRCWIARVSGRSIAAHSAVWHVGLDLGDLARRLTPAARESSLQSKKIGVLQPSTP
jgi:hypothetical protein